MRDLVLLGGEEMKTLKTYLDIMTSDYSNDCFIDEEDILIFNETDLCNLYSYGNYDFHDIYILLLSNLIYYKKMNNSKVTARISFLISYFIFVLWTPPMSEFLSTYYIELSLHYDKGNNFYKDFYNFILKGN